MRIMNGLAPALSKLVIQSLLTFSASGVLVRAERINLDYGDLLSPPSAAYGGAAHQPGYWNMSAGGHTNPDLLLDLAGALTDVTIEMSTVNLCYARDNAFTFGDDQNLLDDGVDLGGLAAPDLFTIRGLDAGAYDIYIYAWGPESPLFRTGVSVQGGLQSTVGGEWTGVHQPLVTYVMEPVTLLAGQDLIIETRTLAGFGTLNGIQIVPEPRAAALGAVFAVLVLNRCRSRFAVDSANAVV